MPATRNTQSDAAGPEKLAQDVLYRDRAVGALDVQRAADALLRQGIKPSVAALRDHLGGGSPNTLTPLLAQYWEGLGQRLQAGPAELDRVPEALARVTELVWRRAVDEARERVKWLQGPAVTQNELAPLQEQILKLSVALAEARAREGEQVTHLASLSRETESLKAEKAKLLALLKGQQALLDQHSARVTTLEAERNRASPAKKRPAPKRARKATPTAPPPAKRSAKRPMRVRPRRKPRKPK